MWEKIARVSVASPDPQALSRGPQASSRALVGGSLSRPDEPIPGRWLIRGSTFEQFSTLAVISRDSDRPTTIPWVTSLRGAMRRNATTNKELRHLFPSPEHYLIHNSARGIHKWLCTTHSLIKKLCRQ